ncbi:MAG: zinc metallopeptidase [Bacilli bacterium]|nr:zinc metallopeptidase [Bacilli bacterium]MDD3995101.1 zinc metallopeptidase [Bacilli bacterium]
MDLIYVLIPLVLVFLSQHYIKSTYSLYDSVKSRKNMSGFNAAKTIADKNKLNIKIEKTSGYLTDHFDPKLKVVRLSTNVYDKSSIASIAIAAHECGHVIQHKEGYFLLRLRSFLAPIVSLTSTIGYMLIAIGALASISNQILIGIIIMGASLLFQLVTLPVEFDASKKAKKILLKENIITVEELPGVNKMLQSAAFTYVASFLTSLTYLLRFLSMYRRK